MRRARSRAVHRLVPCSIGREKAARLHVATEQVHRWQREMKSRSGPLHDLWFDRASRLRIDHLVERLSGRDRGARESALAEAELASTFVRAGVSVRFLPESQARTADLECHLGLDRFFVEVTALVGAGRFRKRGSFASRFAPPELEGDGDGHWLVGLVLGRIARKAQQLADYCSPVVLAVTLPSGEQPGDRRARAGLDLRRLAGSITVLLPLVRQISAVLLSLWDIEPAPRSGARLANVYVVERSSRQAASPRARLLIINPVAGFPLSERQVAVLRNLL
ncbi:MAG: hypothetical protein AB1411_15225 [Nitrospirota bacterium]